MTASSRVLARARRQAQREVALERARLQQQVRGPARRARLRDLDERADRRGGEQPRALGGGVGVGAQRGRDRHDGERARRRPPRRRPSPAARVPSAAARARARSGRGRRAAARAAARSARAARRSAGVLERGGERVHACSVERAGACGARASALVAARCTERLRRGQRGLGRGDVAVVARAGVRGVLRPLGHEIFSRPWASIRLARATRHLLAVLSGVGGSVLTYVTSYSSPRRPARRS